jgi:dihydrofolate synthase/folylpolyglutamate synthase
LVTVELPGRFQVLPGRPTVILDVAHNPHAASALNQNLGNMGFHPYTYAVFGSMQDKDIDGVLRAMAEHVDHWCLCDLPSPRAATAAAMVEKVRLLPGIDAPERSLAVFADPRAAYANAMSRAGENDRIVVFGSFLTVAGVMAARKSSLH